MMKVGDAALKAGLPAKTLRYYEEIGLVAPARRDNGYRDYSEADISRLTFLQRARGLGFSIDDCRALLSLWGDKSRASADVKAIAAGHLQAIERKIEELQSLHHSLSELVQNCHGDDRADCPILADLAGAPTPSQGCCE